MTSYKKHNNVQLKGMWGWCMLGGSGPPGVKFRNLQIQDATPTYLPNYIKFYKKQKTFLIWKRMKTEYWIKTSIFNIN